MKPSSLSLRFSGFFFLLVAGTDLSLAADDFGRFFTTPAQRQRLEELRNAGPEEKVKIVEEDLLIVEEDEEAEEVSVDALTIRGLVYRGGEKSTAWINESNTYEGGLSSDNIQIGTIESKKVEIKIPSEDKNLKLRVGETFDPATDSSLDIVKDSMAEIMKAIDGEQREE